MTSAVLCPIMHEPMQVPLLITPCGHTFEAEAILTWLVKKNKCPVCRVDGPFHVAPNLPIATGAAEGANPDWLRLAEMLNAALFVRDKRQLYDLWVGKAAATGDAKARCQYGVHLFASHEYEKAVALLKGLPQVEARRCCAIARFFGMGGEKVDEIGGLRDLGVLAKEGDTMAQYVYGSLLLPDPEGVAWCERSGEPDAYVRLSEMYQEQGEPDKASRYFLRAQDAKKTKDAHLLMKHLGAAFPELAAELEATASAEARPTSGPIPNDPAPPPP